MESSGASLGMPDVNYMGKPDCLNVALLAATALPFYMCW